jgi:nucleotide-binding universal stress UspA family protein
MVQKLILAAIGRLPHDISVLKRAIEIAAASGAKLEIVHILDLSTDTGNLNDHTSFLEKAACAARDRIDLALSDLIADPAEVKIQIVSGPHATSIINILGEVSPDLIVMRAHQKVRLKEKILGSTTDRVIAAAQTPVLVVKRAAKKPYDRVVLATNGTDSALGTSQFVTALLPDAKLTLVQAVQIPPQLKEAMLRVGSRNGELKALRKMLMNNAKDHLGTLTAQARPNLRSKVVKGDPAKVLTKMSGDKNVDLMVLGQGRSSLVQRAFIGSVSRRLLRDASCDVLIWCRDSDTKD